MKIKVSYAMSQLEKKLWNITPKFSDAEFEPRAEKIAVKGLKIAQNACFGARCTFDPSSDEGCLKMTGMTPAEYQAKHRYAWSA